MSLSGRNSGATPMLVGDEEWLKKHLELGGIKKMKIEEAHGIKFATGKKLKFS